MAAEACPRIRCTTLGSAPAPSQTLAGRVPEVVDPQIGYADLRDRVAPADRPLPVRLIRAAVFSEQQCGSAQTREHERCPLELGLVDAPHSCQPDQDPEAECWDEQGVE